MEKINMQIKKIIENKTDYMKILLEADPDEAIVKKYLSYGDLFVLEENGKAVCVAVVVKYDDKTCELKNIATAPQSRGKGYAGKMIKYLFEEYKEKYD